MPVAFESAVCVKFQDFLICSIFFPYIFYFPVSVYKHKISFASNSKTAQRLASVSNAGKVFPLI